MPLPIDAERSPDARTGLCLVTRGGDVPEPHRLGIAIGFVKALRVTFFDLAQRQPAGLQIRQSHSVPSPLLYDSHHPASKKLKPPRADTVCGSIRPSADGKHLARCRPGQVSVRRSTFGALP